MLHDPHEHDWGTKERDYNLEDMPADPVLERGWGLWLASPNPNMEIADGQCPQWSIASAIITVKVAAPTNINTLTNVGSEPPPSNCT